MARSFASASSEYLENANAEPTAFSFSCWFYADSLHTGGVMTECDASDSGHYLTIYVISDGDVRAQQAGGAGAGIATAAASYSASKWHHVLAVFNSNTDRRVYLDGGNKGTNATNTPTTGVDVIRVGRDSATNYFNGKVAEVAMWTEALSDADAAVLGAGYSPLFVKPQSRRSYWPLGGLYTPSDENPNRDIVGGYNMTAYNTPTTAAHPPIIYPSDPQLGYAVAAAPAGNAPTGHLLGPLVGPLGGPI